ncbi:MAG: class A beta-lactamase-related serine hydrolase, partial [Actinomycetota bacterium]|nr:class A beta-lactamase-related serine hydrolase [Actinomycetota bacterium]
LGASGVAAPAAIGATGVPARAIGPSLVPTREQFAAAREYAHTRRGAVAVATIDASGRLRALHGTRAYPSASVVKAMLLVAYLDRPQQRGSPLSETARRRLGAMIRRSGNPAATWAYRIVGPEGLRALARRARMRRFAPAPAWGSSRITAIDQARFFLRIDRLVPERHRAFARGLLSGIVPSQRWGIPAAAPAEYAIFFKGGWRRAGGWGRTGGLRRTGGWVVHQVARLEHAGSALSIAILTRDNPSMRYGTQTIRGVAARLLR